MGAARVVDSKRTETEWAVIAELWEASARFMEEAVAEEERLGEGIDAAEESWEDLAEVWTVNARKMIESGERLSEVISQGTEQMAEQSIELSQLTRLIAERAIDA